jgi:hypothetical protein
VLLIIFHVCVCIVPHFTPRVWASVTHHFSCMCVYCTSFHPRVWASVAHHFSCMCVYCTSFHLRVWASVAHNFSFVCCVFPFCFVFVRLLTVSGIVHS